MTVLRRISVWELVVNGEKLIGILALKDVLEFLSLSFEGA